MRPIANMVEGRSNGDDGQVPGRATAPLACFLTTEAALDAVDGNMPTESMFQPSVRGRRKPSPGVSSSSPRRQSSPSPTTASIASLSSSTLDLESDTGLSAHPSPRTTAYPAGFSPSISGPSSTSSQKDSSVPPYPRHQDRSKTPICDSAPQFIMPSVIVPQRRPFSDVGRSIGKLKILVAGQSGVGKTSLVQSITQCCQHIVHVDNAISLPNAMNELYASTRPLPWWRTELDLGSSNNTRRYSTSEILDRNLCFAVRSVSRPQSSAMTTEHDYVESHILSLLGKSMSDTDLWTILSNGGEGNVDVVLYMLSHHGLEAVDIDSIKALQQKTSVIPVLARCDELDAEGISHTKIQIKRQLDENDLECFSFTSPASNMGCDTLDIYAVSSATQPDYDIMDASTLMSSGYAQPLVPTELEQLVGRLFSADGSAWLRHAAATKCIRWLGMHNRPQDVVPNWSIARRYPVDSALTTVLTANPFAPRQHWDRVEALNWAQGLRRSLQAEQYEHICQQKILFESSLRTAQRDVMRHGAGTNFKVRRKPTQSDPVHQDPLGLLHTVGRLKRGGKLVMELLSSLGIIGCFAAWLVRLDQPGQGDLIKMPVKVIGWYLPL